MSQRGKIFLILAFLLFPAGCADDAKQSGIYCKETVVAGGADRFMEVRHVVIKGSNYEIGRKIAEIAQRDNIQLRPSGDPSRNDAQRRYMKENYPIYYERMKGLADGYYLKVDNNVYDFSTIEQFPGIFGCSAVFYPGEFTQGGHDILSRNYDFTTGNMKRRHPGKYESPVMSRPYIFEIYPDRGFASLYITAFDLLGGVLDGINSEGLAVAVFVELEGMSASEPNTQVGVHEIQCMRYLLDSCASVKQAKQAMLNLKHYYTVVPCHYIIADRFGKSFVFEFSPVRDKNIVVDGDGLQYITNHLISKYQTADQVPEGNHNIRESFSRLETLRAACGKGGGFGLSEIKNINTKVAIQPYISNDRVYAPARTLWHAVYDLDKRKLSVKFYLGEQPDSKNRRKAIINYSDYLNFSLDYN